MHFLGWIHMVLEKINKAQKRTEKSRFFYVKIT